MVHRSADIKQLTYVITCIIAGQKRCKLCKNSTNFTPDIFLTSNFERLKNGACDHAFCASFLTKPDIPRSGILTYQQITPDKRIVTISAFFKLKITKEE